MVPTLVRKELRETLAFVAPALALYLVYVGHLTGMARPLARALAGLLPGLSGMPPDLPFIQGDFNSTLLYIGAALGIALGFRQSAWEPSQRTALYLLHLPLPRRTIVLTKLLTGVGLLLACTLTPIGLYGLWAATPRTHPGPFEWSMTGDALRVWAVLPLVYLGAFASGLRPARWFGSRLLPLAAVALPATAAAVVPWWWSVGLPILALATAALTVFILREAETRDY
ncbi:hypothetical protein [Paludisphaera soli]|uniref:hypothetical protein n=1 Tax=Paludisphaera soli TaxID=2712865 RepID=UPI0013E9BB1C|nr:hypothetical protein [Paludisphaera soli]